MLADVSGILTIRKVINHGNSRWRVSTIVGGRRRQRFFKTKADAEDWLSSIRSLSPCDQFWKSLPIIERHKIMLIYKEKQSFNAPLLESKQPSTIAEAVTCYLDIKQGQGLRPKSIKQIRWNLSLLNKAFGQMQCDQISTTILEKWFQSRGWKRSTVDGAIAKIGPFFNWCVREGLAIKNPLKGVMLPKADQSEPCIFNPEDVRRLMEVTFDFDPSMLPYLSLGIFAGIRPEEIDRLIWEDITENSINIRGKNSKTRQRRIVRISANLRGWLSLGGSLPIKNKRKRLKAIREAARVNWGQDIMRHTFASYHLAYHGSPDRTAHELGHRDTNMLFRHYRQLVTKEDAEKFWAIKPEL